MPLGLPTSVTSLVERVAERLQTDRPQGYRLAQTGRDQMRAAFRLGDEEGVHLSLHMSSDVLSVALIVEGDTALGYLRRAMARDRGRLFGWLDYLPDYSLGVYTREVQGRKPRYVPVARLSLQPTFPIWLNIPLSKSSAFFKPLSICETLAVGMAIITP